MKTISDTAGCPRFRGCRKSRARAARPLTANGPWNRISRCVNGEHRNVNVKQGMSGRIQRLGTIMTKEALIQKAYDGFALFKKPRQCTTYTDFEEGEFNALLLSSTRRSLTMEQVGTVCWSPISAMTPEALAYFMPRLIELAVTHAIDVDGDPFFCHFIHAFSEGPGSDKFGRFQKEQKNDHVGHF